jgi:hypothetical protein
MQTRATRTRRRPGPEVERLRRVLLAQAPLFAEEKAYVAGVEDAIAAVLELGHIVIELDDGALPDGRTPEPPARSDGEELPPDGGWFG